jgi:8-oxo-dGTP pyrophosphatase MutT (NUDIX family)
MFRGKLQCEDLPATCPDWGDLPEERGRQSAVLVLLCGRSEDPRVLLTRRPLHLNRHAGEIAFPGGRRDPHDRGPCETAFREAKEEIGIDPEECRPCMRLGRVFAYSSDFEIHPVLAILGREEMSFPMIDRNEVDEILLPSARSFFHPQRLEWGRHGGIHFLFPVFEPLAGTRIWGATARILWQLGRILEPIME